MVLLVRGGQVLNRVQMGLEPAMASARRSDQGNLF
jgi:hypothetical protein